MLLLHLMILIIVFFDQLTKYIVLNNCFPSVVNNIIVPNVLCIFPVWNTGVGLGLLQSIFFINNMLISIVSIVLYRMYFFSKKRCVKDRYFYFMIFSGGLSNCIDRIVYGAVFDFIKIDLGKNNITVCNVADIVIFVGLLFIIFNNFKGVSIHKKHL